MGLPLFLVGVALVVTLGTGLAVCRALPEGWQRIDWPLTFQAIANVAQTTAILIAGWWTYRLFVRQRLDHARANITHKVDCVRLGTAHWLVKVTMQIQNVGNVPIRPPEATVVVHQLAPLSPELTEKLLPGGHLAPTRGIRVDWPKLDQTDDVLRAQWKFRSFLLAYGLHAPHPRPQAWPLEWTEPGLKKRIDQVYTYRSRALHASHPFPLPMCEAPFASDDGAGNRAWSERPGGSTYHMGGLWTEADLPMNLHAFHHLASQSICRWWREVAGA